MAPWTEAEEKAVKRKLDKIVLPLVTMSLLLGGVDKVILGTSATFGLRDDLGLVGQDYSWASSLSKSLDARSVFRIADTVIQYSLAASPRSDLKRGSVNAFPRAKCLHATSLCLAS